MTGDAPKEARPLPSCCGACFFYRLQTERCLNQRSEWYGKFRLPINECASFKPVTTREALEAKPPRKP